MTNIERFAKIAGYSSPQWPEGRPVHQSARDRRLIYGQRTPAPRIVVSVDDAGRRLRECNARTLDIARPSQTRGSSRIPDAQDIAHALGAVSAGRPERDPNPLGVAALWDWITQTEGHPWVPAHLARLVLPSLLTGRNARRFNARERVTARLLAPLAAANAYKAIVTVTVQPTITAGDPADAKVWRLITSEATSLLACAADYAAADALAML